MRKRISYLDYLELNKEFSQEYSFQNAEFYLFEDSYTTNIIIESTTPFGGLIIKVIKIK